MFYILKWSQQTSYHLLVYKVCQHTVSLAIFLMCTLHPVSRFILQLEVCTFNPFCLFHLPPPLCSPLSTTSLFSMSMVCFCFVHLFCFFESSYKWELCSNCFLCLTYFSYPNTLPGLSMFNTNHKISFFL